MRLKRVERVKLHSTIVAITGATLSQTAFGGVYVIVHRNWDGKYAVRFTLNRSRLTSHSFMLVPPRNALSFVHCHLRPSEARFVPPSSLRQVVF